MGWQVLSGLAVSVVLIGPLLTGTWTSTLYAISGGALCALFMACSAFVMMWWRSTRGYAIGIWLFYLVFLAPIVWTFQWLTL